MAKKSIENFTVTILGWEKHNSGKKRGHPYFLLSCRFFDDSKIRSLTAIEVNAYLWLLGRCADETRACISATHQQLRSAVGPYSLRVASTLNRLEELQLLRIEKNHAVNNIIEDNRIEEKVIKRVAKKESPPHPPSPLFELWNKHRGNLSEAVEYTKDRKAKSEARWRECPDEAVWIKVIQSIATSPFCNGDNDRGWKANFDFILKKVTRTRVLEGQYANFKKISQPKIFSM